MKLRGSRVAVTGATGFLGGYLVDKLLARGARVVAVVRSPAKASPLATRGAEIRKAELADRAALERAFSGCDAVISNAAVVSFTKPRETHATNVEGTRNVFEALAAASVPRAIAISSASAYVPSPFMRDEGSPLRKSDGRLLWDAYGASKAEAERIAAAVCSERGVGLTIFRPCGISGARDPLLLGALETLGRFPVVPMPVFTRIGVVHAEDVAEAVALALEKPEAIGRAYNLQGATASLWQVATSFRRAGGASARVWLPVPFPFLLRYDDGRARRELGWQPRDLTRTLEDAVNGK